MERKRQTNAAQKRYRPEPTETVIPRGMEVVDRNGTNLVKSSVNIKFRTRDKCKRETHHGLVDTLCFVDDDSPNNDTDKYEHGTKYSQDG